MSGVDESRPDRNLDSGVVVTPACSPATTARQRKLHGADEIGATYGQTASVAAMRGWHLCVCHFPGLAVLTRGSNTVTCSTELAVDDNRANDKKTGTVTVIIVPFNAASPAPFALPTEFVLSGCRPNPVLDWTAVSYDLAASCHTRIEVYDIRGRLVRTLVDAAENAGRYRSWGSS